MKTQNELVTATKTNNNILNLEFNMKNKSLKMLFFIFLTLTTLSFGQSEDLKIFGYFQNNFTHFNVYRGETKSLDVSSFLSQQMNVFLQKNFDPQFSAFVNLEFTNSFSAKDEIGGFKVEEAWLKYSPSSLLNIKGGILIPRFNNFNEIKNRTVLLPYIYRPIAYETYFFDQYGTGEFVPTSANVQAYGDLPLGDLSLNYAAFYGNSETNMLNKNSSIWGAGQDPTPYKMYGGRLGVEYKNLQLGASMTYDRKNLDSARTFAGYAKYNIGYIPRTRVGAYLNYSIYGFDLEGEYIKVTYKLSDAKKALLALKPSNPKSFDKSFYHANLLYNVNDKFGAYVGYDYLKGGENMFITNGINVYSYGLNYKVTDAVILKAQYEHQQFSMTFRGTTSVTKGTRNDILLGASVSF